MSLLTACFRSSTPPAPLPAPVPCLAGAGDMAAYDPQCLFADPFAGFNGVQRFQRNVSNLGGLMQVRWGPARVASTARACLRTHASSLPEATHTDKLQTACP